MLLNSNNSGVKNSVFKGLGELGVAEEFSFFCQFFQVYQLATHISSFTNEASWETENDAEKTRAQAAILSGNNDAE